MIGGEAPPAGAELAGVPLFPLPNVVLFPHMLLPLHVFEPRYRDLVAHALARDRRFALPLLQPGWEEAYYGAPPLHAVTTVGEIVHHEALDDGRSNLVLRGLARVRIVAEERTGLTFRTARLQVLADERPPEDEAALSRTLAVARHLFSARGGLVPRMAQKDAELLFSADVEPALVIDAIAAASPAPSARKHAILAELRVLRRAELVAALLADQLSFTPAEPGDEV